MLYLLKQHNSWQVERTLKDCHNHNNTHSTAARYIFHSCTTQCTVHLILPSAPPHAALMSCHQHGAAVKTRAMAAWEAHALLLVTAFACTLLGGQWFMTWQEERGHSSSGREHSVELNGEVDDPLAGPYGQCDVGHYPSSDVWFFWETYHNFWMLCLCQEFIKEVSTQEEFTRRGREQVS